MAEEAPLRLDGGIDWDDATRWHDEPGGFVPVAKETPEGSLHYIVTDHLGTPREVFGEAGNLVWAAEYRTWGAVRRLWLTQADNDNATQWGGTIPPGGRGGGGGGRTFGALALKDDPEAIEAAQLCPIRFQGRWEDFETGLSYNRFRYYDALSHQYIVSDPTGLVGGVRSAGYVKNPTFWVDPLGLAGKTIATGGSGQKYISGTNPVEGYGHVPDGEIRSAGEAAGWNPKSAGYLDRSKPGSFYCCHTEQKAYIKGDRDISVDKDMCPSCQGWFDKIT
ncbi:RHS repeat-associated core domain-containing protein [Methylobacterium sp. Leaf469]|uniref:RHS repeat domain-containing protein n=1 Tax=Methylobacterium sp. Leaf469 TaxID=1736387 RepID=UPI001FCE220E|nr:RHS repeat-associated core domain-containing protein [Methylobacterium sp. Leaf469]